MCLESVPTEKVCVSSQYSNQVEKSKLDYVCEFDALSNIQKSIIQSVCHLVREYLNCAMH